ncbi:MAG: hypothetical protein MUE65_06725 [Methanomassiliicoccales archaeon]|nr:hypothetical protein [Methanomassiliicoccales archaeon]
MSESANATEDRPRLKARWLMAPPVLAVAMLVIRFRMDDVRTVVSLGMTSICFQMVYDGVLVEVTSQIYVGK